jgi:hypothetical protein
MLKRLTFIALALVAAMVMAPATAHATETTWTLWGGARYETSQDEAKERLPEALRALNIPEAVRPLLEAEVRSRPGTLVYLNPGDRFVAMMSGPDRTHASAYAMTNVVVGTNPGPRAGIVQSPVAREWRVTHEGQTYVLVLPDICNNWAWRVIAAPRQEIPEEPCAEVELSVQTGDTLLFAMLSSEAPPPSRCWAVNQSGRWEALPGGCMQCVNWDPVVARVPEAADRNISMQSRIGVRTNRIRIRVPVWAESHHLAFYLIRSDDQCSWVIIPPNVWQAHTANFSQWRWRPQGN